MKAALISLTIGIILVLIFVSQTYIRVNKSAIDIYVHDTYFVISYFSFIFLIILFLGTFFSIGGAIGTVFKNKYFTFPLLICILLDSFYIMKYIKLID